MERLFSLTFFLLYMAVAVSAQRPTEQRQPADGVIYGTVLEKETNSPIEFANIVVYDSNNKIITGSITDKNGKFSVSNVKYGKLKLEINFIGYGNVILPDVIISANKKSYNTGKIYMSINAEMLGEVEVEASMNNVDFRLDRKVINVDQDIVSSGASAVEVLENAPSITTDIDGNVSLRGTESFLVLIDGRPSPLEGSEALQQIPANTIENIEIITNPSAKYAPDGVGGIINVILKKDKRKGYNGQVSANYGSNNTMGATANFNFRTQKFNFFVGGEYNRRRHVGDGYSIRKTFLNSEKDSIFALNNSNSSINSRTTGNVRAGVDFYITDNDIISVSGKYGLRSRMSDGITEAETFYQNALGDIFLPYSYYTDEIADNFRDYWTADINYQKKFTKPGHEIQIYASYSANGSEETNEYTEAETDSLKGNIIGNESRYRTFEVGKNDRYSAKADYVLPFNEKSKLEAGYEFSYRNQSNDYKYQILTNSIWVEDISKYSPYDFVLNVQSGYVIYSNFWGKLGYQFGLRTEFTDRLFAVPNKDYKYHKFDFFPSVHLSYAFTDEFQLMTSYSRRLERPSGRELNPMIEVEDPNNVRMGNPSLNPEYTNSFDLSAQKRFGEHFVSLELYSHQTNDKIDNITLIDSTNSNLFIKTFDNIGSDMSVGSEIMGNLNFAKWYNLNISLNGYYYAITSDQYLSNSTFTWRVRLNNTFRIKKSNTSIQLGGFYFGPSITAQGYRKGAYSVNFGIKQEFFKKQLSVSLNLRDIFRTMNHDITTETDDLYYYMYRTHKAPTFNISVSYKINDFKKRKENPAADDDDGSESEM